MSEVSVEAFFLLNMLLCLAVLGAAARCAGRFRLRFALLSAALGAAYAVASEAFQIAPLRSVWARTGFVALTAYLSLRPRSAREAARCLTLVCASAAAISGLQLFLARFALWPGWPSAIVGAGLGFLMVSGLFSAKFRRAEKWEVQVILRSNARQTRFPALIDTGNRLREPISGLPVMIVEEDKLRGLVPETGLRKTIFGGVGGRGELVVFRPEILMVNYSDGFRRASDVWIGVYPGRLPGDVCALAPAIMGAVTRDGGGIARV